MDANAVIQIISTVGFPIVACSAMGWYVKYNNDKFQTILMDTNTKHKQEMDNIVTAINNNTLVMQKLIDKMEA